MANKTSKRDPRLMPHTSSGEISNPANMRPIPGQKTMIHRAEVDFITDAGVSGVNTWAEIWILRWPETTLNFWRRQAKRRNWDLRRSEVWEVYQGRALDEFVATELEARSAELVQLRAIRQKVIEKISDDSCQARTMEGMVRALVDLDKHITERREVDAAVRGEAESSGNYIDAEFESTLDGESAQKLVRHLLLGGGPEDDNAETEKQG